MTGPSEVDPVVLAGDPGSARQLEGGDDDLLALGDDPDERAADAFAEDQPPRPGESH